MQNKFDNNNFEVDIELAKKYAFRVRLREVFVDGLLTQVKWNFMFVLCCLPIVTLGPALAALYNCTNLHAYDDYPQYKATKCFLDSFVAAFKKTVGFGLAFGIANLVFGVGFAFYLKMTSQNIMYMPMASISLVVLVLIWCVAVHLLPMLFEKTDFENGTIKMNDEAIAVITKQAVQQALLNGKKTIITVVLGFAIVAAQLLFVPASIPVILVIGLALPAQIAAFSHTQPEILD